MSEFHFKQFSIYQQHCAMKVTTDGCLFGSLINPNLQENETLEILDIGCGTGLLSLMLAQRLSTASFNITAVELDGAAAKQAYENVQLSPWKQHIQILEADFLKHNFLQQYQLIICNPPFYQNQLQSPNSKKNTAHHSTQLPLDNLIQKAATLLAQEGHLWLLLPNYRLQETIELATTIGLKNTQIYHLHQTTTHRSFRVVLCLQNTNNAVILNQTAIYIKDTQQQYTPEFSRLLGPYYLKL